MEDKMKKKSKALIPNTSDAERENTPDNFGERTGYSYETSLNYQNTGWVSTLKGDTPLSQLSIPGTHNSMSRHGGGGLYPDDYIKTQRMDLQTQLNSGARYLDIRLRKESNTLFTAYHGSVNQHAAFGGDILNTVKAFLQAHPGETVLMRVKNECNGPGTGKCTDVETSKTWAQIFEDNYYNNPSYRDYFWKGDSNNPKLNEVRGKIVVLSQFPTGGKRLGIPYGTLDIQDHYEVDDDHYPMYDKWKRVKAHLEKASANSGNTIFLNHLSGNGAWKFITQGASPYFVASGQASKTTGVSPKRLTPIIEGVPVDFGNAYPDYPRVYYPEYSKNLIHYEGTNNLTVQRIKKGGIQHTGIVAADFPGGGLMDSVIQLNNKHRSDDIHHIGLNAKKKVEVGFTGNYLSNTYVLTKNGEYIAHYDKGTAYYSYLSKTDYGHLLTHDDGYSLFTGDKIVVWLDINGNRTLLREFTVNIDENNLEEVRIPPGKYSIVSALNNSSEIALSTSSPTNNVVLWGHSNGELNGRWNFVYDSNKKAYQIKNEWKINEVLTWTPDSINVYTSSAMGTYNGAYWILKRAGNGYLYVENKESGTVLDVTGGGTANGTNINVWGRVPGEMNQKFKIKQTSAKETHITTIVSGPRPQSGQKNRSSGNFKIQNLPTGARGIKWVLEANGSDQPTNILFNVMHDVTAGSDPVIWRGVKHGTIKIEHIATGFRYYIANPSGATQNFTVKVYAIH
ncbi:hypothetical protein CON37_26690 [Bacillus cereus]|nr:hypothetical protein CON37_26690 [Bacillus cereus]